MRIANSALHVTHRIKLDAATDAVTVLNASPARDTA